MFCMYIYGYLYITVYPRKNAHLDNNQVPNTKVIMYLYYILLWGNFAQEDKIISLKAIKKHNLHAMTCIYIVTPFSVKA